ncbi:hypothetical protein [Streptomyces fradiae]|uniref:hypothetical protein n=1 Tax=Streptomyces fradiae TaxID=1906 RepID=UPI002942CD5B|nr:hypothetical protein [Streptomyces fradiae]WOI59931.1 hypothetical protein RYQ63_08460 [Streptomyces fradiae]
MPSARPPLPPVRLRPDAELARAALAAPVLARAVRLARWAGQGRLAGAGGELAGAELAAAVEVLGLAGHEDGEARTRRAWRVALGTGLAEVRGGQPEAGAGGVVAAGEALPLVTRGGPRDVLGLWSEALEAVCAETPAPDGRAGVPGAGAAGPDPRAEAAFLDDVLAALYLLTVSENGPGGSGGGPVPLPALAASVIVPDGMGEPTDDVLVQVSGAMTRLDGRFRALAETGLVEYRPVDRALLADEAPEEPEPGELDEDDVARYGMVRLTPLGLYGMRRRLSASGVSAPAVGDLAGRDAGGLLAAVGGYPPQAARAETERWLAGREPLDAARALLAAAKGADTGSPLRRLHCQQALALVGDGAEPAVREVLDDPELGGLARVWLAERGAADVPPPPEPMVFWLAVDTIAAHLDADGDLDALRDLVEGLAGRHGGFFDQVWRVEHPSTPEVLEAVGRLHRDRRIAKDARKAAFKARSRVGA